MRVSSVVLSVLIGRAYAFVPVQPSASSRASLSATVANSVATPVRSDTDGDAAVVKGPIDSGMEKVTLPELISVMKGPIDSGMEEVTLPDPALDPSIRIQPGRYADVKNSIAIPFLPRPPALDGSHAGDYGFDPLGLSEKYDLYMMQESELRHGRLAMLAVVGWPMSELMAPDWMLQHGCAPSVLNGFNPLTFLATAMFFGGAGYFEYKTALRRKVGTTLGDKHAEDMANVWDYGVAGDYNFDPLNLYSSIGDGANARKGLRDVEIAHGRSAMLGITAFAFWEGLTGHPIVENSMFFHPNALLPFLAVSYFALSQIYEVGPLDEYPIQLQYTSEGEMRLAQVKKYAAKLQEDAEEPLENAARVAESISAFAEESGINDKLSALSEKLSEQMEVSIESVKENLANVAEEGAIISVEEGRSETELELRRKAQEDARAWADQEAKKIKSS